MTDVINNIISMDRGDFVRLPIFINANDEELPMRYILRSTDMIYFAIKEPNQPFEQAIVRKILTSDDLNFAGDAELILEESDTKDLVPGVYYYEIKVAFGTFSPSGLLTYRYETIMPERKFILR